MTVIHELADQLGTLLLKRKLRCAVAESCTGGGLAAAITDIAGSSQWFDRGFVTYTNEAKEDMLAVPHHVIAKEGAVSESTVRAMAHGAMMKSDAEVSVAISGIAGPSGGSLEKPVGTVWVAWAGDLQATHAERYVFGGDRSSIRQQAVQVALEGLIQRCLAREPETEMPRYFFALWPDDKTAQALYQRGRGVSEPNRGKTVRAENLHMTLVYLGSIPPEVVQSVQNVAKELHVSPFELKVARASYWPHIRLRWLGVEDTPQALEQLVMLLKQNLLAVGFKPEKKPYIPHITIARQCTQSFAAEPVRHLSWLVHDVCLVKSTQVEGRSHYEIIQRWPL